MAPGWTPYRFAFNSPLYYTDPNGLFETKLGARIYKLFKGGDEIGYDPNKKEYYVGSEVQADDASVYKRVFRGNDSNPGGGILNAADKYPTGLGYAGKRYVEQGDHVEDAGDLISAGGMFITPFAPPVGVGVMKFGSGVSLYGVGMQAVDIWVTDDINKEREILKKLLVEGIPIGAVKMVSKRIKALPITDNDKRILESIAEGQGYILEKTSEGPVNDLINEIFDKMEWTEK